jgi:hypothetical protein
MQFDLFERRPLVSSSSGLAAPRLALSPIIGLRVQTPQGCRACGGNLAIIGSSAGPHAARLNCAECSMHAGWLGRREVDFITRIVATFGCPLTPIILQQRSP